jgi:hypothetical protein
MFKTELLLEGLSADLWCLAAPLVWVSRGETITVPAGVITDLASIPRVLRNLPLFDIDGISRRPSALHDWLYMGERWRGKPYADWALYDALLCEGMSTTGALAYYYGVHWFAAPAWRSDGARRPFATSDYQLDQDDFISPATYEAWVAARPMPRPVAD